MFDKKPRGRKRSARRYARAFKKKKKKREKVFMSQPSLESQLNPRLESFIRMDGAGRRRGERREASRKESAEREKGERESLVISISIPSTACAETAGLSKQTTSRGGTPHYYFPSFLSPGVHIPSDHKHQAGAVALPSDSAGV